MIDNTETWYVLMEAFSDVMISGSSIEADWVLYYKAFEVTKHG